MMIKLITKKQPTKYVLHIGPTSKRKVVIA
jgi:hypothetical protein